MELSLIVTCLCAGVKVLYAAGEGENEAEVQEKRGRRKGLMSLKVIHSTLWKHSELTDILFSTSDSKSALAAKGCVCTAFYHFFPYT